MALTGEVKAGLVTAAATLAVGLLALNHALVGVFYDDGLYAGLATALTSWLGYVHPNLPSLPGAVHYPPLYPIVLSPLFGILSVNAAAMVGKVLNALLSALAAGLLVWHASRTALLGGATPRWAVGAIVFAAAVAIPVLATQGVLFAEPLFGVLLVIAIIAADRCSLAGDDVQAAWIAGIAAALALLTRSIAIALVAGICGFMLLRPVPRRLIMAALVPGLIAALAWSLWVSTHARQIDPALALGYGTYFAHVSQAGFSAVAVNVPDMSRPLEALVFGWMPWAWFYDILATVSLGVGLYGLWLVLQRSAIGISLLFYFVILAIWPHPPDRFLWAVLPWLALIWAAAMFDFWRRWPARAARIAVALLGAVVVIGYAQYEYRGLRGHWWDLQAQNISANFAELLPVVANLPDSAVIATDDEALVWLYTRRRAVPLYLESYRGRELIRPTAAEHRAYLERMHVTHVLLASATSPSAIELRGLLGAYPTWLTGIYRWSDGRWLFAVNRGQ